jgi:hypothetical protein
MLSRKKFRQAVILYIVIYPLLCNLEIISVNLYSNKVTIKVLASNARRAATHRKVKNSFAFIGVRFDYVFHQRRG